MGRGKEIPKTNPAEIEKLIEQIRGTNLEPGSRMRQPTEGTRMSNGTLLSIRVISPRQSSITLEVIRRLGCRAFRLNGAQISIHYRWPSRLAHSPD